MMMFKFLIFWSSFSTAIMAGLNIGSLNINGCRDKKKRSSLFNVAATKKLSVLLLQETHSDVHNEVDWQREWKGQVFLSHSSNTSAGVAVLLSDKLSSATVAVSEVVAGRMLRLDLDVFSLSFSIFNVYAPNSGRDRTIFFKKLMTALSDCPKDRIILVAGDYNCTLDHVLDRNHAEPHPGSADVLRHTLMYHDLVDVWREQFPSVKQYSWIRSSTSVLSGARLDRFYVQQAQRGRFCNSSIAPTFLSDHHFILVTFPFSTTGPQSSHWRFNAKLLQDNSFLSSFEVFWEAWRERKVMYPGRNQWWDIGKRQIQVFCQQYTTNRTDELRRKAKALEEKILSLSRREGTDAAGAIENNKVLLRNLWEERGREAMVRARFAQLNSMDMPTSYFFSLEKKSTERKLMTHLKLPDGSHTVDANRIISQVLDFYQNLYSSEPCEAEARRALLLGVPQLPEEDREELDHPLSLAELTRAVNEQSSGKSPGLDGLPAEFYQALWGVIGPDLHEVFQESMKNNLLPLSCRRAVISLLPKKGDLGCLKNWRPVSLLGSDLKILSKALTNRLKAVLGKVIHPDQSYCIPGRSIFDSLFLIRDMLGLAQGHQLDMGLVSLDQEKAYDRVSHSYLFEALGAFGFGPSFVSYVRLLYTEVYSLVKVNGAVTRPFRVGRGIRQGCSLSGLLYTIAIEPLLIQLRRSLQGLTVQRSMAEERTAVKLIAYADDVTVIIRSQEEVAALLSSLDIFAKASSAKVNWGKTASFLLGGWQDQPPPRLPVQQQWGRTGLKILGVCFGSEQYMEKNWDGLVDKVTGKLRRWEWIKPQLSYRGRVLVVNNLAASMLWHRLTVLDPPAELVSSLQKVFVNFIWDSNHWLPPGLLYLPVAEGGQGLVDISAKVKAMRLQSAQKLLYGEDKPWVDFGRATLRAATRGFFDRHVFLLSHSELVQVTPHSFYGSVLKAWSLFTTAREEHFGLEEPLFSNTFWVKQPVTQSSVTQLLLGAGVTKLKDLIDQREGSWRSAEDLASTLGVRSLRMVEGLLRGWKDGMPACSAGFVDSVLNGGSAETECPDIKIAARQAMPGNRDGQLLTNQGLQAVSFKAVEKRTLYNLIVKCLHFNVLKDRPDTKWRAHLSSSQVAPPAWRTLYKGPLPKRSGDLQWRVLHCALATKVFVAKLRPDKSSVCGVCNVPDNVFHMFCDCVKLHALFTLLDKLCSRFGLRFSKEVFIFGVKYSKKMGLMCTVVNFLMGQAKLCIWKCNRLEEEGCVGDRVGMFKALVESRITVEHAYYQAIDNLELFDKKWCVDKGVWTANEGGGLRFLW